MIKYNLERLAVEAIINDGTYNSDEDWWTSFTTDEGKVYDVNVYHPDPALSYVRITIYNCIASMDGTNWVTDTESEAGFIEIPKSIIMPDERVNTYDVTFQVVTEYTIKTDASGHAEALLKVKEMKEKHDLIARGVFKDINVVVTSSKEVKE